MRGLRTQEGDKFEKFFSIVQDAAAHADAVFFGDSGEGNEIIEPDLEGEDMFGWMIPEKDAEQFEQEFLAFKVSEKWDKFQTFANWKRENGKITIMFTK